MEYRFKGSLFYEPGRAGVSIMQFNCGPGYYGNIALDFFKEVLKFSGGPWFVQKRPLYDNVRISLT